MSRDFVARRLLLSGAAEILCLAGNLAPAAVAVRLWGWAVRLDPHQEVAAVNRASTLLDRDPDGDRAWDAFTAVLEQLANPGDTSASDLHLHRTPHRGARRLAARAVWGGAAAPIDLHHDASLRRAGTRLAAGHFRRAVNTGRLPRAERALDTWRSLAGPVPGVTWGEAELAWLRGDRELGRARVAELLPAGAFPSPFDALRWGERLLDAGEVELARTALELARRWLPEVAALHRLLGEVARRDGDLPAAAACWERALSLDPQDLGAFLARLVVERPGAAAEAPGVELAVEAPAELPLGSSGRVRCRLVVSNEVAPGDDDVEDDADGWTLYPLPPAGWGLLPAAAAVPFDGGVAEVTVTARRPDRVRGKPWPLVLVAVGRRGHCLARASVRVPDPDPGRVLVTVTEDHEIHEERGTLDPELLRRLLVEKSRFAAGLAPWTHQVETGSVLAMTDWAAERGGVWAELRAAVRRHLAEEVARGNDLQPHLHTFNDPAYAHFPYQLAGGGWRPSLRFLLTAAEERGDWASACPPPGHPPRVGGGADRVASVERSVAQLEAVARLGSPDYRAVLWRSGLLEIGDDAEERAWSAVALLRAGLLADSDLPKPASPRAGAVVPAFPASGEDPFSPHPGGPLLQLPIVANLEGDFRMGRRALARRVRRSVDAVRGGDGRPRPGVHLFTLLTHDKFLNARRGGDEFHLDPDVGDWRIAREQLEAWRRTGAEVVTAGEGVRAVVDDRSWHPVPLLEAETFVAGPAGEPQEVRYRLRVLGRGIVPTEAFPHHLPVPIPCSLRGRFVELLAGRQGSEPEPPEIEAGGTAFWWRWHSADPIVVTFRLREPIGPTLALLEPSAEGGFRLRLEAPAPFLAARVAVSWARLGTEPGDGWEAFDGDGAAVHCRPTAGGLLLERLRFEEDPEADRLDHPRPLELRLRRRPPGGAG